MADTPISAGTGASDSGAGAGLPTITANFDKTVTALVERRILENLRHVTRWLVPGAFISGKMIAGTNLIRHIAYGDLPQQDSIIAVEGTPPEAEDLAIGFSEYPTVQRGRLVKLTDVAMALSPHELMGVAAERVAWDAMSTVDQSIADAVIAGTGITGTVASTGMASIDIKLFVAQLKNAFVPTFPDGFYVAMIHPNVAFDIQSDTAIGGWIEASKYGAPEQLFNGEIGRIHGVRFIETTVGTINPGATDTYNSFVFGPDYFAFGDLQSLETFMVRPGGSHADPLAQSSLVGYKGMWGAKTLEVTEAGGPRFVDVAAHAGTLDLTA